MYKLNPYSGQLDYHEGTAAALQVVNNLSDVDDAKISFDNIKQTATNAYPGVSELSTDAEALAGTDTVKNITPSNLKAVFDSHNQYAEMYFANNSVVTIIETANTPICLRSFSTGIVQGWTFAIGTTGAITAFSNGTGKVNVASATHTLETGDIISIRGTTNYNGIWVVTKIDDSNFSIPDTWVADDGASDWEKPSHLSANVGSAGLYKISWQISSAEAGAGGGTFETVAYINDAAQAKTTATRKFPNNDIGCMSGTGLLTVADGDKLFLTMQSDGIESILNSYGDCNLIRV